MLEVGRTYTITMLGGGNDGSTTTTFTDRVIEAKFPLIKVRGFDGSETIINTASHDFVSAVLKKSAD